MSGIPGSEAARHFTAFAGECIKHSFEFMPPTGSSMGLHEYDGRLPDLSTSSIERRIAEIDRELAELRKFDASGLDADTQLDCAILRQGLEAERFHWAEFRQYTYDPMFVLFIADVTPYIKLEFAPFDERVKRMTELEAGIPTLIEQCIKLLQPPLARPVVETAIGMFQGQANFMRDALPGVVADGLQDRSLLAPFTEANDRAVAAIEAYAAFLKEQLPGAKEDFAIGAEMFARMLAVNEHIDLPLERVLEVGRANLEANKQAFIETARQIDPRKSAAEVFADVSLDHPTAESLIPDTAAMLEEIRQYLIDNDIISVPSEVRCKVEETPEFMRWGFAFMASPGPFEQVATDAYYYVTPVERDWSDEQKEQWLRRFNYPTLRNTSVHEAYPGHYVHFLHASEVMSPVRKAFGSYSFVEGWAHYCEQMMVEQGFSGGDPKPHLAQLADALTRNTRYVVSILMHTGRMTLDEATQFMMENAFMEELPAKKEATRGTFDPGYLNYTLGKLLILKLREDMKAKEGAAFNVKDFHDRVLGLGYPPLPLVRQYLLGEDRGPVL